MTEPVLLRLDPADTVAVARTDLSSGMTVTSGEGDSVILAEDVPAGHKVALVNIGKGDAVVKFGVNIGTAVAAIGAGAHVHVHNLESERMRGDRD